MEFKKLNAPSLRELFVEQIQHMILSGQLKIGEKLPSERQLCDMMQVSRAVVNSGLAELEKRGFIVVKPRSGTYVADYRQTGNLDTLIAIMNYNDGRLRNDEIKSIFEVRIALDTLATRLCMERITDEEIELLREKVEQIRLAGNAETATQAAFDFQHQLAISSGNTLIPLIFQSFKPTISTLWYRFYNLYGVECLYERNYKTWTYVRDRDLFGAINWIEESMADCIHGEHQVYY